MLSDKEIERLIKKAAAGKLTKEEKKIIENEIAERKNLVSNLRLAIGETKPGFVVRCEKCGTSTTFRKGEKIGDQRIDIYANIDDQGEIKCACGNQYPG